MEHIVVHKDTAYHSAFPHVIRLRNGDLACIFRQSRFRQGFPNGEARDQSLAHYHLDPDSRIALVRSTDDGRTWDPDSFVVVDASDGSQDLNMGMIAELPSGELLVNNHDWFTGLSKEQGSGLDGKRSHLPQPDSSPYSREWFGEIYYDSAYTLRSTDAGRTWSKREAFNIDAYEFFAATERHVVEALRNSRSAAEGLTALTMADMDLYLDSPAYKRLIGLVNDLAVEERVDLGPVKAALGIEA